MHEGQPRRYARLHRQLQYARDRALVRRALACLRRLTKHPNGWIRRDAGAFFASPDFDRIAALAQLDFEAIALIRETARQRAVGGEVPVSRCSRKRTHTYQQRSPYLVRHLEYQGEVRPLQEWYRRLRLKPITVYVRLHRGWTVVEALTRRRESRPEPATATPSHFTLRG